MTTHQMKASFFVFLFPDCVFLKSNQVLDLRKQKLNQSKMTEKLFGLKQTLNMLICDLRSDVDSKAAEVSEHRVLKCRGSLWRQV